MLFFPLITQLQRSLRLIAGLVMFGVGQTSATLCELPQNKNSRPAELIGSWNEGVLLNSDELEAHAKTDTTEDFVVLSVSIDASTTSSVVTAVEGDVVSNVRSQGSALGQLDWSGQARNDVCQTACATTNCWKGVIVETITNLNGWHEAKPWGDFNWIVKTNLSIGTADGEVIEITSVKVHRAQCGSDSQTDFVSSVDAEITKTSNITTDEAIHVFIVIVDQSDHSCASVVGQTSGEVEFGEIKASAADLTVLKGVDILSAKAKRKLLSQRDVETQADVEGVVSTIQTALIVAGVISDREACANGVKQSAVFLRSRWNDAFAWGGSACNCIQARASGQNEC